MTRARLFALVLLFLPGIGHADDFTDDLLERVEEAWSNLDGKSVDDWVWRDKNRFVLPYRELAEKKEPSERQLAAAAKRVSKLAKKARDTHYRWRLRELAGTLLVDAGDPKRGLKELRLALEDYPNETYPDPLTQSAFQHVAQAAAAALLESSGAKKAEDFLLELVEEDRRLPEVHLEAWISTLFGAGEGARLPGFAERLADAYGKRGKAVAAAELRDRRLPTLAQAQDDERMTYVLFPPRAERADRPARLVLVLPGGNGQALDFLPWMTSVQNRLGDDYVLAVLSAPQWNTRQAKAYVWVTEVGQRKYRDARFSSETFVEAVYADVLASGKVQVEDVALMGWSSGGPPTYAALLREGSSFERAFVLASVFRPDEVDLAQADGKRFYLAQGVQDQKTPIHWAISAEKELSGAGATVEMELFQGGHGFAMDDSLGSVCRILEWTLR